MKMQLPDGKSGFGVNGLQLQVQEDGSIDVPDNYAQDAIDHGLIPFVAESKPKKPTPPEPEHGIKSGDKISLRFEGDKKDTIGNVVSVSEDGEEAVIHIDGMDDLSIDVKFLTVVEG